MKRQMIRLSLALLIVISTVLAAWVWTSEYDSDPDPKARFEIEGVQLTKDRSNAWLEIHLKKSGDKEHNLRKKVRLITANGLEHEPADNTFAGNPEAGFTDIWFKFWLDQKDLEEEILLQINDGRLRVKTNQGAPEWDSDGENVLKSSDWRRSWLGF